MQSKVRRHDHDRQLRTMLYSELEVRRAEALPHLVIRQPAMPCMPGS